MGVMRRSSQNLSGEQRMPSVCSGKVFQLVCAALAALALSAVPAGAVSRIKDLANIEGVRQNQLIGYGLVVGLNGTGDTLNNIPFTKQSLTAMLTANLPPFGTQGTRIDITVSSLGDAKSLQG